MSTRILEPASRALEAREQESQRWERVPDVLDLLKTLYRLTDEQIAIGTGFANLSDVQKRRTGARRVSGVDLAVFAAFFKVPTDLFFLTRAEAASEVLRRDPDLVAPYSPYITARAA